MRFLFIFLLIFPFAGLSQTRWVDFPSDTSFTVWSAGQKIARDFPQAKAVVKFSNLPVSEETNVVYYTLYERKLTADLFFPKSRKGEKIPAVILIHGGGWASGNKSHLVPMAQKLAENGFFAATVEHRLSPEAKFPAAVTDLKTFVKWVKNNAEKYGIDSARIAVLGCSSGATLASFLGATGNNPVFKSHPVKIQVSDAVQAVVNIDGIVDFTDPAESGKDDDPAKPSAGARWLGSTFQQNPGIWKTASPLTWVNEQTPPTLFINSALPRFHAGREPYLEVLTKNNIYSEVHTIENTPHPFWLFYPWFDEAWPKVVDFLRLTLK